MILPPQFNVLVQEPNKIIVQANEALTLAKSASFALRAGDSNTAITASYALSAGTSTPFALTSSYAITSSYSETASYAPRKEVQFKLCDNQPAHTILTNLSPSIETDDSDIYSYDLSNYGEVRLTAYVVTTGSVDSFVAAQWSADQLSWSYLSPALPITSSGVVSSHWISITTEARTEIFIRWVAAGGDGISDPAIRYITLGAR